jgi:hypothetical protein
MCATHAEELAELSFLVLVVRRVPGDVRSLSVEEVCTPSQLLISLKVHPACPLTWNENLVLVLLVAGCENVCTLQSLREETKDVVDQQDGLVRRGRTGDIGLQSIDGDLMIECDQNCETMGCSGKYYTYEFTLLLVVV